MTTRNTLSPFSFEKIHSDIAEAGIGYGFVVVPQFSIEYKRKGKTAIKKPDLVWLSVPPQSTSRTETRIVAAFEVEGFNVPIKTIKHHMDVYSRARRFQNTEFSCYVPLYSSALHRQNYGRNRDNVKEKIEERENMSNDVVRVCDGGSPKWLDDAKKSAKMLANPLRLSR